MNNILPIFLVIILAGCATSSTRDQDDAVTRDAYKNIATTEFKINEFEFFVNGMKTNGFSDDQRGIPAILRPFFPQYAVGETRTEGCPVAGVKAAKEAYLQGFVTDAKPFPEWFGAITSFNVYPLKGTENVYEGAVELCSWHRMADGVEDSFYMKFLFGKHIVGEDASVVEHPYLVLVKKIPNDDSQKTPEDPLAHLSRDPFPGTLNPDSAVDWDNMLQMLEGNGYQYKLHASGHEFMASMIVEASMNGVPIDMSDDPIDKRDDCFDMFFGDDFLNGRTGPSGGWNSPPKYGSTCLGRCDVGIIATAG